MLNVFYVMTYNNYVYFYVMKEIILHHNYNQNTLFVKIKKVRTIEVLLLTIKTPL